MKKVEKNGRKVDGWKGAEMGGRKVWMGEGGVHM